MDSIGKGSKTYGFYRKMFISMSIWLAFSRRVDSGLERDSGLGTVGLPLWREPGDP